MHIFTRSAEDSEATCLMWMPTLIPSCQTFLCLSQLAFFTLKFQPAATDINGALPVHTVTQAIKTTTSQHSITYVYPKPGLRRPGYCRYPTLHIVKTEESIRNLLSQSRPRGGSTTSQAKGIKELHKHSYAEKK